MGLITRIKQGLAHRKAGAPASSLPAPDGFSYGASYFAFSEIEKNTTVIACTNFYAHAISILPLNLYRRLPDGSREKAIDHPLYSILRRRPNLDDSPIVFMAKIVRHIKQKGNAYIFKNMKGGEILSLHILNPERVTEDYSDWPSVSYKYQGRTYSEAQILHITGIITNDHGHGVADVDLAKAAVTLGNQFDQAALTAFGNGLNSKLFVKIDEALKDVESLDDAQKIARQYADYLARNYCGPDNAGKPFIGLNKMEVTELKEQKSNREAELLESRKWQDAQICKAMTLPTWCVDGSYKVEYGNLESAMIYVLNFSLMPLMHHLEQRFGTLLAAYEQETLYFEFDFTALLRTDVASRAKYYQALFQMGAISPEMIDAKENLEPPEEGGKTRFFPGNLAPLRKDVLEAWMAGAKLKAQKLLESTGEAPTDPSRASGDDKQ